ncbi:MAG: SRPBCC domain-containing protein [Bacteroidetes bacterium]|nr:SRPBCC domain-containing protein [Bacteroidota bacterium]
MNKLSVTVSIEVNATPAQVWRAFTEPALIKEYMFGTDTTSDWKKGSTITYKGVWQGKSYEDKGTIVDIVPEKLLHTTYYSPLSGKEDKPENYANVIEEIKQENGKTIVSITQDNIEDEQGVEHMRQNWNMVLDGLKKTVESL